MQKNRYLKVKSVRALVLALLFTAALFLMVPQQAMAEGGSATVTLGHAEGLSPGTSFEFELYKVGHFNDDGKLGLDDALKDAHVKLDYDKEDAAGWLSSAWTLAQYIENNNIKLDAIGGSHTLKPGESFTESGLEDGLYIVMSHTVRDAADDLTNWTPQPVYIAVLGGDSSVILNNEVVTKIVRSGVTIWHRVTKLWEIKEGDEKYAKPSEINVNIRYGGKIIDTIKLNSGNNWTYEWKSEESGDTYKYIGGGKTIEFKPADTSHKWTVDEIFTVEGFREAYGRDPDKKEKEALDKLASHFTMEILPDQEGTYEVSDPVTQDEHVTLHRIKNVCKGKVPPPPGTGDENKLAVWAGIMAAAALLLIALFTFRRKHLEE